MQMSLLFIYIYKWVDEKSEIVEIVMECFPNCEMNNIQIVMGNKLKLEF
jgi:hypothetical protein